MEKKFKAHFKDSKCRISPLLSRLFGNRVISGAEIGVWRGKNAQKLLTSLPHLFLVAVDMWDMHYTTSNKDYYENTKDRTAQKMKELEYTLRCYKMAEKRLSVFPDRYKTIKNSSRNAALSCENSFFDFVYIDASHKYKHCREDLLAWLPKIKIGGYICGHDYNSKRHRGVRRAVNRFHKVTGLDIASNRNVNGEWIMGPINRECYEKLRKME